VTMSLLGTTYPRSYRERHRNHRDGRTELVKVTAVIGLLLSCGFIFAVILN
jgi:hypothetical protein